MKRGYAPKPVALKMLEGNPGKEPIPVPPKTPPGLPSPPPDLDAYALEEWERIVPDLDIMGILSRVDQTALAAYCDAWATFRRTREALNAIQDQHGSMAGLVHRRKNGELVPHPLLKVLSEARLAVVRFATEFGMTPSARVRLATEHLSYKQSKFAGLVGVPGGDRLHP